MGTTFVVTTSWPHQGDPMAGTFVVADAIARAARADRGGAIVVLVPKGPGAPVEPAGLRVVPLPHGGAFGTPGALERLRARPLRGLGIVAFAASLWMHVRAVSPSDEVVVHWVAPVGLLVAAMLPRGVRLRAVAHGGDVRMLAAVPVLRRWARSLADRFSVVQAVSPELAERLGGLVPGLAIEVAPMPLDEDALREARQRSAEARRRCPTDVADGSTPLRVVAARLIAGKHVERALHDVAVRGGYLVIAGDGPERDDLARLAIELGIRHRFLGIVPHVEALMWLAAADEVLAPLADGEGAPTVIREAIALGVPVRTYDAAPRRKK